MRKFYLESADGDTYGLNGEKGIFTTQPTGLGFTAGTTYADITHGFFTETSTDKIPQSSIVLTLNLVRPSPYSKYRNFINWIERAQKPLVLVYEPIPGSAYRRQVTVRYYTKTEIERTGVLVCPLSLSCLTPWYRAETTMLEITDPTTATLMRFDFRFSPELRFGSDSIAAASAEVAAAGHEPASFLIRVPGPVVNPQLSLRGQSGKLYGRLAAEIIVPAGSALLLSTRYRDSYVVLEDSTGQQTDLINSIDINLANPFFRAPVEERSSLELNADSAFTGATAEVYYYYRSV